MPTKAQLEEEILRWRHRNVRCEIDRREALAKRDEVLKIINRLRNRDGLCGDLLRAEDELKTITEERDGLQTDIDNAESEMQAEWAKHRYGPNVGIDDIGDIVKIASEADDERERNKNLLDIEERRLQTAWRRIAELEKLLQNCGIHH